MTLVEFLIEILSAHANSLQRLAAFLGEDRLIDILEMDPLPSPSHHSEMNKIPDRWFTEPQSPREMDASVAYRHLEGAVQELGLPAVLEFHLWAYPYYRLMIESPIHLQSKVLSDEKAGPGSLTLIEQAIQQAQNWFSTLPIPAPLQIQAQRASEIPWIRFRANILKKMGKSLFVRV